MAHAYDDIIVAGSGAAWVLASRLSPAPSLLGLLADAGGRRAPGIGAYLTIALARTH
jgi:hypothetical protein